MQLDLGSTVHCTDGAFGELADIVIDPIRRRVTHLVVQPHRRHDLARLVPVDRAQPHERSDAGISLDCTIADLSQFESVQKSAYLRLGEFPIEDPEWEVGITDILALPYYESLTPGVLGTGIQPVGYESHVTEVYDRIPKDKIEIRRASAVVSSDGHHLGHVDGFVVDDEDRIGHLLLEHGHLWGKREITVPIGAVGSIENDEVQLSLSKDQVGALESVPVRRWPG